MDKAPNGNGTGKKRKRSASGSSDSSSSSSDSDSDSNDNKEKAPVPSTVAEAGESVEKESIAVAEKDADPVPEEEEIKPAAAEVEAGDDEEMPDEKAKDEEKGAETEVVDLDKAEVAGPRALHKTSSIFLRNLAPTITKAEVEAVCRRYDGYLRVAIADPLVDRRWFRRGWVSFRRDVNIKEICWNLNNIRVSRTHAMVSGRSG